MYRNNPIDIDSNIDPSVFQPASKKNTLMPASNCYTGNCNTYVQNTANTEGEDSVIKTPEILTNPIYVPAYLKNNIGKFVRLEMLFGNSIVSRIGKLVDVGTSFLILKTNENETMLCDIYIIKLVTLVNNPGNLWMEI